MTLSFSANELAWAAAGLGAIGGAIISTIVMYEKQELRLWLRAIRRISYPPLWFARKGLLTKNTIMGSSFRLATLAIFFAIISALFPSIAPYLCAYSVIYSLIDSTIIGWALKKLTIMQIIPAISYALSYVLTYGIMYLTMNLV